MGGRFRGVPRFHRQVSHQEPQEKNNGCRGPGALVATQGNGWGRGAAEQGDDALHDEVPENDHVREVSVTRLLAAYGCCTRRGFSREGGQRGPFFFFFICFRFQFRQSPIRSVCTLEPLPVSSPMSNFFVIIFFSFDFVFFHISFFRPFFVRGGEGGGCFLFFCCGLF